MTFRLFLFGGCSLSSEIRPVAGRVAQPRQLALLARLGAASDHGASRDTLAALLWPEHDEAHARHLLSDACYRVRLALGDEALVVSGDTLWLNRDVVWCDVRAFIEARASTRWAEMVRLYTGRFLEGFHGVGTHEYERWMEEERIRCREEAMNAVLRLAERAEREKDLTGAITWLRRGRAVDPFDEHSVRLLMEVQARAGDRAGAVRTYAEFSRRLDLEMGLEPAPETREVLRAFVRSEDSAGSGARRGGAREGSVRVPKPPRRSGKEAVPGS